jgi:hypothetical protein
MSDYNQLDPENQRIVDAVFKHRGVTSKSPAQHAIEAGAQGGHPRRSRGPSDWRMMVTPDLDANVSAKALALVAWPCMRSWRGWRSGTKLDRVVMTIDAAT